MRTTLLKILFLLTTASTGALAQNAAYVPRAAGDERAALLPPAEKVALRVVPAGMFCAGIATGFVNYAEVNHYDHVQSALLVSAGIAAVVSEVKAGRAQPYVSTTALAALAGVPMRGPENGLIPLASLLGPALGAKSDATLAMSAGELRLFSRALLTGRQHCGRRR